MSADFHAARNALSAFLASALRFCAASDCHTPKSAQPLTGLRSRSARNTASACLGLLDFGLARGVPLREAVRADGCEGAALSELTQAGMIMGTAPYMAPEQHSGAAVVPASDQYGFCVALYEALYRVRPFVGADLTALENAKRGGAPEPPTSTARTVPRWLQRAVARGLAFDAADRWPSMESLLAVLERGQGQALAQPEIVHARAIEIAAVDIARLQAADPFCAETARTRAHSKHRMSSPGLPFAATIVSECEYAGHRAGRQVPCIPPGDGPRRLGFSERPTAEVRSV